VNNLAVAGVKAQPDSVPVQQRKFLTDIGLRLHHRRVQYRTDTEQVANNGGDKCKTNSHERRNYLWRIHAESK
jgi:hypothetical protein